MRIDFDHEGCETAKLRIVRTKFRDDPLSKAKRYEKCTVLDSQNDIWLESEITLGSVGSINDMINYSIEEFGDDYVVIQATLPYYDFNYEWVVIVDPYTDQVLWKGEFYVWQKQAHYIEDDEPSTELVHDEDDENSEGETSESDSDAETETQESDDIEEETD